MFHYLYFVVYDLCRNKVYYHIIINIRSTKQKRLCMSSLRQDPEQYFFIALVTLSEQRTAVYLVHGHENPQSVRTLINVQTGFSRSSAMSRSINSGASRCHSGRQSLPSW